MILGGPNDECGPLRDESTSAREVCARQRPGYEEGNLENSRSSQLDLASLTSTTPTGDTDDTLFIEKPIVGTKLKLLRDERQNGSTWSAKPG